MHLPGQKKSGPQKWHDHAKTHKASQAMILTRSQEALLAWVDKHPDPDTDEARADLQAHGFAPDHPPA